VETLYAGESMMSNLAVEGYGFYDEAYETKLQEEQKANKVIRMIMELFEMPEIFPMPVRKDKVPKIGECVLINEREESLFSRIHGGRYDKECYRRYFGKVVEIHPHVVVLESGHGRTSERVADFNVGLVNYIRLKELPEKADRLSYDEKLFSAFARSFEDLLLE